MTPFRISIAFVVLMLLGIVSALFMEVDYSPRKVSNSFIISFSSPNNDPPLVIEQNITTILEGVFSSIDGVNTISSVSRYGSGFIKVTFKDSEIQTKYLEILTAIRQVSHRLPDKLHFPLVKRGEGEETSEPLLVYSLTSSLPTSEIIEFAQQQVMPRFGDITGIKETRLSTNTRSAIIISFDIQKLKSLHLTPKEIMSVMGRSFSQFNLGTISSDGTTKSLTLNMIPQDLSQVMDMTINKNVKLSDVASARFDELRPSYISRLNGKNTVQIQLHPHNEVNKPKLALKAKTRGDQISQEIPDNLQMTLTYDDTKFIEMEISKIAKRATLSIIILSLLILLIYRQMAQLTILIGSVLVSTGITLLILFLLAIPIHLYTIAALTISFGLNIDNSILVVDHLKRKNNLRLINPLAAATLTTISALLIIFILPTDERVGLDDFSMTISLALVVSVVVSLFFTPAISKILKKKVYTKTYSYKYRYRLVTRVLIYEKLIFTLSRYRKIMAILLVLTFGLPLYLIPKHITDATFYNQTIGSPYFQEKINPWLNNFLGGLLFSFHKNVFSQSGYRSLERTRLNISASLDEGHTIYQMDSVMKHVENYLHPIAGIQSYETAIRSGTYSSMTIYFDQEHEESSFPYIIKSRLEDRSLDWGGVDWNISGVGRGFSNANEASIPVFRVKLRGYNYDNLGVLADSLATLLMKHPRIKEVNTNDRVSWKDKITEQITLVPDKEFYADDYIQNLSYARYHADRLTPNYSIPVGASIYPILFKNLKAQDYGSYDLLNESKSIPLISNSTLLSKRYSNALYREDRQYLRVVTFNYYGNYRFGNKYLTKILDDYEFPLGYSYERTNSDQSLSRTTRQYSLILPILFLIYLICSASFESLRLPFYIILTIPFCFIGIFLIFILGGFHFDQGGYASFILTAGLAVNATIFILDEAKQLGSNRWNKNLIKACVLKFMPIMLTMISTCLGLVPFLIDGQNEVFWFSFAVGVIGGLLFSIFLVFIILPAFIIFRK